MVKTIWTNSENKIFNQLLDAEYDYSKTGKKSDKYLSKNKIKDKEALSTLINEGIVNKHLFTVSLNAEKAVEVLENELDKRKNKSNWTGREMIQYDGMVAMHKILKKII